MQKIENMVQQVAQLLPGSRSIVPSCDSKCNRPIQVSSLRQASFERGDHLRPTDWGGGAKAARSRRIVQIAAALPPHHSQHTHSTRTAAAAAAACSSSSSKQFCFSLQLPVSVPQNY
jgi:hypothetical protein